jgi:DNA polymerase III subunit gamma/tau
MSSQTLYRKYRPKNFSEVIGQHHIVETLTNAIKNNRIGQAYLFTGPRGTGKTSIARIFAKTVNCANLVCEERADTKLSIRRSPAETDSKLSTCNSCDTCPACKTIDEGRSLDIIEIDAASNTGVDNIRELRETVNLPPTSLKYKVYIIDEVHMLSTGAFNALLKTLEEPPNHVIFILATTEIHKVPETILSRCQRFDFTRLPIQNIIEKLTLIAKNEKIKIDTDSLEIIAIAAEGGMRDAESLLGQVIALEDKNITIKEVEEILGTADRKTAYEIAELIINNDSTGAIQKINALLNDGYDLSVFNKSLINYLRQLMLLKISPELKSSFAYEVTSEQINAMLAQAKKADLQKIVTAINLFLDAQNKISSFLLPQLPLEIAIIKATQTFPVMKHETYNMQQASNNQDTRNLPTGQAGNNQTNSKPQITSAAADKQNTNSNDQNSKECHSGPDPESNKKAPQTHPLEILNPMPTGRQEVQNDSTSIKQILTTDVQSNWSKLLSAIKPLNHSLQALLFGCQIVSVENNTLTLATPYDFYKEKLNNPANRLIVEDVFAKILGSKIILKTVTNQEAGIKTEPKKEEPAGEQSSLLNDAMKIMGGKVVEE